MKINKNGLSYRPGQISRLTGRRFGLLTVVSRAPNHGAFARWLCRCDCGVEIEVTGNKLLQGVKTKCAGKIHKPGPSLRAQYPREYQSWSDMKRRCLDPKNKKYIAYGARGITVCDRWQDFKNFMLDMGKKPDRAFTIERKDVNGNYEPTNCCWIHRKEQGRNRRNSVYVTYQGKRMLLLDLVDQLGISRSIVNARLKLGFTLAQAIAIPVKPYPT